VRRTSSIDFMASSVPPTGEGTNGTGSFGELSAIAALNAILRHRRWVIGMTALVVLALLPSVLTRPVTYTSVATFLPDVNRPAGSGVSTLAAQFGVAISQNLGINSPQFYPLLIRNAQFVGNIVEARYALPGRNATEPRTLTDLYEIGGSNQPLRRQAAIERLSSDLRVSMDPQTGMITVAVTAAHPLLAKQICEEVLRQVNEFNLHTRQGRASAERKFVENRLAELRTELRVAEDRLRAFAQENRDFGRAPDLQLTASRLQREVMFQQQVYTSLAQSYEQAKIDEVRDTPVITIVSAPAVPIRANPRGRVKTLVAGFAGGLALGIALALLLDFARGSQARDRSDLAELSRLMREIRSDAAAGRVVKVVLGSPAARS
jgi:uncharacterized protein involved in exopolysaccharide biosynthesis